MVAGLGLGLPASCVRDADPVQLPELFIFHPQEVQEIRDIDPMRCRLRVWVLPLHNLPYPGPFFFARSIAAVLCDAPP
jgi:hypothetical protein